MSTIDPQSAEPRWRRLPEERPRQIVEAALAVFGERGLSDARLDEIARRAGVSKGTIYLYFANKEELFREVIRHVIVDWLDDARRHVHGATAVEQLTNYLLAFWNALRTPGFQTVYRLVTGELLKFPDIAEFYSREVITRSLALLGGIIRHGIATKEFRDADPNGLARIVASSFITNSIWCARRHLNRHSLANTSDDEVRDQLMEFILHALAYRPLPDGNGVQQS